MPVQPTYPGVYIEEVPSGVRTITGVATSITAFIGRALRGPVNEPVAISNFGDFERLFGGLWIESTMSYTVRDFYLNGGSQAIIVRVSNGANPALRAQLKLPTGAPAPNENLTLMAASPGEWGNNLSASVDHDTGDPFAPPSSPVTAPDPNLFNLIVYENKVTKVEEHLKVSLIDTDIRYLPRVLEQNSTRITVAKDNAGNYIVPNTRPNETPTSVEVNLDTAEAGTNGGNPDSTDFQGNLLNKTGLYALEKADLFNLLCIPPPTRLGDTNISVYQQAMSYCYKRRAMLLVDSPFAWGTPAATVVSNPVPELATLGLSGDMARNAAFYFPRVRQADPARKGQLDTFVPCGIIAGVISKTDTNRGVWKAPAGIDAALNGIQGLQLNLTDDENGRLNPLGINCLRSFPVTGRVVWGARTLRGADQFADEYKYISVRRTALFIEESLYRGTKWVVFEPNHEPLWAQIRLNVGAFMHNLFRQGAFQGTTPREAYLVKCDKETTTQNDINLGIVNVLVGFAPLKPAEFVIIRIQQLTGQIEN